MKLAAGRRAWERWQAAAGPWQGWTVCPTLLSPGLERVSPRPLKPSMAVARLASSLAPLLRGAGTLCIIDLAPELGVQVAARLVDYAHPVLLLPRWPYAEAVLPVDELAWTLVDEARRLHQTSQRHPSVVFVLDGERARALPGRSRADPRADNRHHLAAFDLPDLRTLRQRGIQRIHRIQYGLPS